MNYKTYKIDVSLEGGFLCVTYTLNDLNTQYKELYDCTDLFSYLVFEGKADSAKSSFNAILEYYNSVDILDFKNELIEYKNRLFKAE